MNTNIHYAPQLPIDAGPPAPVIKEAPQTPPFRDHLTSSDTRPTQQRDEAPDVSDESGETSAVEAADRSHRKESPTDQRGDASAADNSDANHEQGEEQAQAHDATKPKEVAEAPAEDAESRAELQIAGGPSESSADEEGVAESVKDTAKGKAVERASPKNELTAGSSAGEKQAAGRQAQLPKPQAESAPNSDLAGQEKETDSASSKTSESDNASRPSQGDDDSQKKVVHRHTDTSGQKKGASNAAPEDQFNNSAKPGSAQQQTPTGQAGEDSGEGRHASRRKVERGNTQALPDHESNRPPIQRSGAVAQASSLLEGESPEQTDEVRTGVDSTTKGANDTEKPAGSSASTNSGVATAAAGKGNNNGRHLPFGLPQSRVDETRGQGPLTDAQQARLVQRVTRAFDVARARGESAVRLRLSPPELGSLRLEVQVESGSLVARLEVETQAAREVLMENLNTLRQRLAEQGIRVDQFDVDLLDRQTDEQWQQEDRPARARVGG